MNRIERSLIAMNLKAAVPDPTREGYRLGGTLREALGDRETGGDLESQLYRYQTYSSPDWKTEDYVKKGYAAAAGVYSAVSLITRVGGTVYYKTYKEKNQKLAKQYRAWTGDRSTPESLQRALLIKDLAYEEVETHPFQAVLDTPNEMQNQAEFIETSIGFKILTGNRLLYKKRLNAGANSGKTVGFYNLPASHTQLVTGTRLMAVDHYLFNLVGQQRIETDQIVHSRYPNYIFDQNGSHLWGMSPFKPGQTLVEGEKEGSRRSAIMLKTGGQSGVLYKKDATKPDTKEQRQEKRRQFDEAMNDPTMRSRIGLANGDHGYIQFGLTAADLDLIAQQKYTMEQICNLLHIPPGLMSASANATDNNIAAWNKQLISQAVIPELNSLRYDLNEIAREMYPDIYIDYDLSVFPELQEDMDKLVNRLDKMWYYTGNQKRIMTGGDEDLDNPLMAKYLVPGSLKFLDSLDIDQSLNDALDNFERNNNPAGNGSGPAV
jgi:HK97 family phage portal protein